MAELRDRLVDNAELRLQLGPSWVDWTWDLVQRDIWQLLLEHWDDVLAGLFWWKLRVSSLDWFWIKLFGKPPKITNRGRAHP